MKRRRRQLTTLVVATAGFAVAVAARTRLDPWLTVTAVAAIAIVLARWSAGARAPVRRPPAPAAATAVAVARATVLGALLVALTHLAHHLAARWMPALVHEIDAYYLATTSHLPRAALAAVTVVVVVAEELVWRGVAAELMADRSRAVAATAMVALYAAPQLLAGAWLLAMVAVVLGTVLTIQRLATGRLLEPFVTHALWSVAIFVIAPVG